MQIHQTYQIRHFVRNNKFRITSSSKDKTIKSIKHRPTSIQNNYNISIPKNNSIIGRHKTTTSQQPYFTIPVNTKHTTKNNQWYRSIKIKLKHRSQQSSSDQNSKQSQIRLQAINRIFGPKRKTESLQKQLSKKQIINKKNNYQSKVNHYIFETRNKKISQRKVIQNVQNEFWNKVNESLIIPIQNNEEQSKDLREFLQNIITE